MSSSPLNAIENQKPSPHAFLTFAFNAIRAKERKWTGCEGYGLKQHYSIAGHSWLMSMLCFALPPETNVKKLHCVAMATVYGVAKVSEENLAHVTERGMWREFVDNTTPESKDIQGLAKLVKDVVALKPWIDEIVGILSQPWYGNEPAPVDNSGRDNQMWSVEDALEALPHLRNVLDHTTGFVAFAFIISQNLSRKRKGWIRHGIEEPESVAEHSWMMAALCLTLPGVPGVPGVDIQCCMAMAVLHDMAETLVGDITPADNVPRPEKHRREQLAMEFSTKHVSDSRVKQWWMEFEAGETLESKVVQDMDKIEMMIQALCYEKVNNYEKDLPEFMAAINKVGVLKGMARSVVEERESALVNECLDASSTQPSSLDLPSTSASQGSWAPEPSPSWHQEAQNALALAQTTAFIESLSAAAALETVQSPASQADDDFQSSSSISQNSQLRQPTPPPDPTVEREIGTMDTAGPFDHGISTIPFTTRSSEAAEPLSMMRYSPSVAAKSGRCIRCWAHKRKCERLSNHLYCLRCSESRISPNLCSPHRVTQFQPFVKWLNEKYRLLFTVVVPSTASDRILPVSLSHYPDGPSITVTCQEFRPTFENQTLAVRKDTRGWHKKRTTAYSLVNTPALYDYVCGCLPFALGQARAENHPASWLVQLAATFSSDPVVYKCLAMYTALRLLRVGWRFAGEETLGMTRVQSKDSAWHGIIPVPRMIQNQLNHQLERILVEWDKEVLLALHKLLAGSRNKWVPATLATFLLLHIRELDAGRNIIWQYTNDPLNLWLHPSGPETLISEIVHSCNSLLWHHHVAMGLSPLSLNWDLEKNKRLVDGDERKVNALKKLQTFYLKLRETNYIGRHGKAAYQLGKPDSVAFTISSLVFSSHGNDLRVVNFC
ncbi:5'-deoxynucleotidase [Fusarium sp. Ph1]|nr:5'-deoxynucleotidase [Fusarium sp. Ph1]